MNIFISANDRYIYPAQVMLTSFFLHNHDEKHNIYFMYSSVTEDNIQKLDNIIQKNGSQFVPVRITETEFEGLDVQRDFRLRYTIAS